MNGGGGKNCSAYWEIVIFILPYVVYRCATHKEHVCRVQRAVCRSWLFPHHVGFMDQMQVPSCRQVLLPTVQSCQIHIEKYEEHF